MNETIVVPTLKESSNEGGVNKEGEKNRQEITV